jgi:hypothetical protein
MKIDVWRILVVYMFGGIYCDADSGPTKSMTEESPITASDDAFFLSDGVSSICHILVLVAVSYLFPPPSTNSNLFYHIISHFNSGTDPPNGSLQCHLNIRLLTLPCLKSLKDLRS